MKRGFLVTASLIFAGVLTFSIGCGLLGEDAEKYEAAKLAVYEANQPDFQLKPFEIYQYSRIEDIDKSVVFTLDDLGYSDYVFTAEQISETFSVEYLLPDNATQGPETWYIINFHFVIEFESESGRGRCTVYAGINDRGGASVHLETLKVGDTLVIQFEGYSVASSSADVRYYNYLRTVGVKPGENTITFKFKQYDDTRVKRLTIINDTGIEITNVAPTAYHDSLQITQDEADKAKEIAFSDPRVQEKSKGKGYAIKVDRDEGEVEVSLVFDRTYLIDGVETIALRVYVNLEEEKVTEIVSMSTRGMPQLTAGQETKAKEIALSAPYIQELLEGKEYTIGRIGPTQGGPVGRLGANLEIIFDEEYSFNDDFHYFPPRPEETQYLNAKLAGFTVFINLSDGEVVQVYPNIPPPTGAWGGIVLFIGGALLVGLLIGLRVYFKMRRAGYRD